MYEVRIHGRGGQGAVTAANILARAASCSNLSARAFPAYGPERRGAPVAAFLRLDHKHIYLNNLITSPDCVMVIDPKLMETVPILDGLKKNGVVILNTRKIFGEIQLKGDYHKIAILDATRLAQEILGRPVTNTVMLGAFCRIYPDISIQAVTRAIQEMFGSPGSDLNVRAAESGYEQTVVEEISI